MWWERLVSLSRTHPQRPVWDPLCPRQWAYRLLWHVRQPGLSPPQWADPAPPQDLHCTCNGPSVALRSPSCLSCSTRLVSPLTHWTFESPSQQCTPTQQSNFILHFSQYCSLTEATLLVPLPGRCGLLPPSPAPGPCSTLHPPCPCTDTLINHPAPYTSFRGHSNSLHLWNSPNPSDTFFQIHTTFTECIMKSSTSVNILFQGV